MANLDELHSLIGAQRVLRDTAIPAEAQYVHFEIYYTVPHAAVAAVPDETMTDADGNVTVTKAGTPGVAAWEETFRHHLTSLPVETANAIVAAMSKVVTDKSAEALK